jgi:hypothetical protein
MRKLSGVIFDNLPFSVSSNASFKIFEFFAVDNYKETDYIYFLIGL